mgnify:FL=1|jgi:hypothetical protein
MCCGEFHATGRAFGSASVSTLRPKMLAGNRSLKSTHCVRFAN